MLYFWPGRHVAIAQPAHRAQAWPGLFLKVRPDFEHRGLPFSSVHQSTGLRFYLNKMKINIEDVLKEITSNRGFFL